VLLISTGLFTHYFLPEIPLHNLKKILGKAITQGFLPRTIMIKIVNGKIVDDQALPNKHNVNGFLQIDPNSAAILYDQKTGYKTLHSGIHHLPRTASICAIFPTSPRWVIYGPNSADSLSKARRGEGLADFHVRVNAARRTAKKTADGINVYAKFDCFYKIEADHPSGEILTLTKRFIENSNGSTSMITADDIQKHLFNLIMTKWGKICDSKTFAQLIGAVPYKLDLDQSVNNGLTCLVFASEVFLDN
jgi:hypothetical protein